MEGTTKILKQALPVGKEDEITANLNSVFILQSAFSLSGSLLCQGATQPKCHLKWRLAICCLCGFFFCTELNRAINKGYNSLQKSINNAITHFFFITDSFSNVELTQPYSTKELWVDLAKMMPKISFCLGYFILYNDKCQYAVIVLKKNVL